MNLHLIGAGDDKNGMIHRLNRGGSNDLLFSDRDG